MFALLLHVNFAFYSVVDGCFRSMYEELLICTLTSDVNDKSHYEYLYGSPKCLQLTSE